MAGTHSLWSPSGAKAWRPSKGCPGYVVMNDGIEDKPNKYSAEGTAYHQVAERALRDCIPVAEQIGAQTLVDGFKFTIDEENADFAQGYVDRIRARAHAGCIVSVEVRTDTSGVLGIPEQTGTVDARIFDIANETLEIRDLKFGAGVKVCVVEPEDGRELWERVNDQLGIYGTSEWFRTSYMCDWKWLKLVIDQPRIAGGYSEVTLSRADVQSFASAVLADAQKSYKLWQHFRSDAAGLQLHLNPSLDACRWCARAGSCKVRTSTILETYHQMTAKNLPLMSGAELAVCLDKAEEIEAWLRAARAEALSRVETKAADAPPGWKIVEGRRGDRTANPDDIARRAREAQAAFGGFTSDCSEPLPKELYTDPELKTVAQLEKACKKLGDLGKAIWGAITGNPEKGIPSLITQASGRPTLVRDFDQRPELAPQAVSFELRPVGEEFSGQPSPLGNAAGLL